MKDEKKANKAEEVKTEKNSAELTDEELAQVSGGTINPAVTGTAIYTVAIVE